MKEYRDLGIYEFDGLEEGMAIRWMWKLLTDLSFKGKVEVIWRILTRNPPKWIYNT